MINLRFVENKDNKANKDNKGLYRQERKVNRLDNNLAFIDKPVDDSLTYFPINNKN